MNESHEMTIGSEIDQIPSVSTWLEEMMEAEGFSPEEILDTQLAVEEVITNIIIHGYKRSGCTIRLSTRYNGNAFGITIVDSAPRFDPLSMPEPDIDAAVDDRKIGGLGIYLVRQVMDSVSYRYENGSNILLLEKKMGS